MFSIAVGAQTYQVFEVQARFYGSRDVEPADLVTTGAQAT